MSMYKALSIQARNLHEVNNLFSIENLITKTFFYLFFSIN